jgi:hypothetical protein
MSAGFAVTEATTLGVAVGVVVLVLDVVDVSAGVLLHAAAVSSSPTTEALIART